MASHVATKLEKPNLFGTTGKAFGTSSGFMLFWGTADPAAADDPAAHSIFMKTGTGLYQNTGDQTTPVWSAVTAGAATLDQVFDNGKVINGAITEATAFTVGGATDNFTFWQEGANDIRIGTSAGANITIKPEGGTVNITGALDVSSTIAAGTANAFTVSAVGAVVAVGVNYGAGTLVGTGNIAINTTMFTVDGTTGDTVIAGTLTVTGLISGPYSISALNGDLTLTADATTGAGLTITGDTVTTGSILYLHADASLAAGAGFFIRCVDVATDKFSVKEDGRVTIAGAAAGTDALLIDAGDATLTAGNVVLANGNLTLAAGTVDVTPGSGEGDAFDIAPLVDGACFDINLTTASNLATGYIDIDSAGTGTGPIIAVAHASTYTGAVLSINQTNAVGSQAISLTGAGTRTTPLISITDVPANGSATFDLNVTPGHDNGFVFDIDVAGSGTASLFDIAFATTYAGEVINANMTNAVGSKFLVITGAGTRTTPMFSITDVPNDGAPLFDINLTSAHANGFCFDIDEAGTSTNNIFDFACAGAYAGDVIKILLNNGAATVNGIVVSGSNTPQAAVNVLSCSGIPNANGRVLEVSSSGNASAANVGISARFLETGAAQATSFAVQIDSTSNEALNVSTGKSFFAESISVLASPTFGIAPNYVQAAGAANAITATLTDAKATNIALTDGLMLLIDLNTRTLQAGANTLDFNGGGAVAILSHNNPGNNIGTAYAANGFILLVYSSGTPGWLDLSQ